MGGGLLEGAQAQHGDVDVWAGLHGRGQVEVAALGQEAGGVGNGAQAGLPYHTGRDVGDVNSVLDELEELDALVDLKAAGDAFGPRDAVLNQQIPPTR